MQEFPTNCRIVRVDFCSELHFRTFSHFDWTFVRGRNKRERYYHCVISPLLTLCVRAREPRKRAKLWEWGREKYENAILMEGEFFQQNHYSIKTYSLKFKRMLAKTNETTLRVMVQIPWHITQARGIVHTQTENQSISHLFIKRKINKVHSHQFRTMH